MDVNDPLGQEALDSIVGAVQRAQDERRGSDRDTRSAAATRRRAADLRNEASAAIRRSEQMRAAATADGSVQQRLFTGGLRILRLPLTTVERLTGHNDSTWGPALGFDVFGSAVLQVAGGLLGSESLVRAGRSRRSAATTALTAAEQLALAQRLERQAMEQETGSAASEQDSQDHGPDQLAERRKRTR